MTENRTPHSTFGGWMGSMWLYTVLRFALFFALWGIVYLLGVHGLLGPLIALVLSVPLSFVLLAKPRALFVQQLERRMEARKAARADLDTQLDPDQENREEE
jgi:O-antigen ligase